MPVFPLNIRDLYGYVNSLTHEDSIIGIRHDHFKTFIAMAAKHKVGAETGYAYVGGELLCTPTGYAPLSWSIKAIAIAFDQYTRDDLRAWDADERALTKGAYLRSFLADWYWNYHTMITGEEKPGDGMELSPLTQKLFNYYTASQDLMFVYKQWLNDCEKKNNEYYRIEAKYGALKDFIEWSIIHLGLRDGNQDRDITFLKYMPASDIVHNIELIDEGMLIDRHEVHGLHKRYLMAYKHAQNNIRLDLSVMLLSNK